MLQTFRVRGRFPPEIPTMQTLNSPRRANLASVLTSLLAVTAFLAASWQARAESPAAVPGDSGFVASGSMITLAHHTPPQVLDGRAVRVDHYNPEQKLRLVLVVQPPKMAEEEQFLKELTTKGNPNFHKFLSPDQWNARFGPSVEAEQKVVDWAQSVGLTVTNRYSNRLLVDVEGTAGTIEKALGVTINNYKVGEEVDFSNDRDPVISASLSGVVSGVLGLNSIQRIHGRMPKSRTMKGPDYTPGPMVNKYKSANGDGDPVKADAHRKAGAAGRTDVAPELAQGDLTGNSTTVSPFWVFSSQGYDYDGLQQFSHCCNVHNDSGGAPAVSSISLVTFGDYEDSDVQAFFTYYGFAWNYNSTIIGGSTPPGQDDEAPGDLEYSTATANSFGSWVDTAEVSVYEVTNGYYSTYADAYNQIATDNNSRVVSTSYGGTEDSWNEYGDAVGTGAGQFHGIFNTMTGEGYTLIASAGDNGSADGCADAVQVDWPAADPNFIAAGGTGLTFNSDGTFKSEVAWTGDTWENACGQNWGGGGGGASALFSQPYWQSGLTYEYYDPLDTTYWVVSGSSQRLMPDISLSADPDDSWEAYYYGGGWSRFDGTSIVAPELAGFFAQENTYLNYIGNICGSAGTSACTPVGNPAPFIYEDAQGPSSIAHNAFYDITSGCNSNNITADDKLDSFCATSGWDAATGWGSANLMQLAWGINWELVPAYGSPSIAFNGPATNTWYNTNQEVSWTVSDAGSSGLPAPGVAGFTQGWDSIPADPFSEPHGGTGNSFYSGPEYPFGTTGCLEFVNSGCSALAAPQGCHTAYVEGWDNQGNRTTQSYGPVCYDTVAPTITISNSPATPASGWWDTSVQVTLHPTDPGGSNASGIFWTLYAIDSGSCYPGNIGGCYLYTGPITISAQGQHYIYYFTEDNAGNFSAETYEWVSLDLTAPTTTSTLGGNLVSGTYYSAVKVGLNASDTGGSGVKATYYQVNGGATTTYAGSPITVAALGANSVVYWSVDNAGNIESQHTVTFTVAAPTATTLTAPAANSILAGPAATFSWGAVTGATGYSLWLGSTGAGSENLYHSGATTAKSVTATGLPTNGETVYARLFTYTGNVTKWNDYTFTAASQAVLTAPAPATVLAGPTVTFSWSAGTGNTTGYSLWLGSTGVGSNNLYHSGLTAATTVKVGGMPTNGEPIYARLYTYINGWTVSTDYTFTAASQAVLTTPAPATTLAGPSVTFTWAPGTGSTTGYSLYLGSTGAGSNNLYHSGATTATSVVANGLPTNGETVYARLFTYVDGVTVFTDYTYTAASQAVLTAPAPATVLAGPTVTFTWSAGTGNTTGYSLWLGSTGVGSNNLYHSGLTTATAVKVGGLPANGAPIYARLYTYINGSTVSTDYTFTAASQAVLTTPAPTTTLAGSSVTFTWTPGTGSTTGYSLYLGSTGAGSNNLYHSGATTATSVTANGLPTNGETVYARLFTYIDGVTVFTDYTYTAQ